MAVTFVTKVLVLHIPKQKLEEKCLNNFLVFKTHASLHHQRETTRTLRQIPSTKYIEKLKIMWDLGECVAYDEETRVLKGNYFKKYVIK